MYELKQISESYTTGRLLKLTNHKPVSPICYFCSVNWC